MFPRPSLVQLSYTWRVTVYVRSQQLEQSVIWDSGHHFEGGVRFLFFSSSWSAISLLARSVTTMLKVFLFRFFHFRNWFKRFFRSSISFNNFFRFTKLFFSKKVTVCVKPSAVNRFQSYCRIKEQKDSGGFPTLNNFA